MKPHIVYIHRTKDWIPFYIGTTSGIYRMRAKKGRGSAWDNISKDGYYIQAFCISGCRCTALRIEAKLIKMFGLIKEGGILSNREIIMVNNFGHSPYMFLKKHCWIKEGYNRDWLRFIKQLNGNPTLKSVQSVVDALGKEIKLKDKK